MPVGTVQLDETDILIGMAYAAVVATAFCLAVALYLMAAGLPLGLALTRSGNGERDRAGFVGFLSGLAVTCSGLLAADRALPDDVGLGWQLAGALVPSNAVALVLLVRAHRRRAG